MAEISTHALTWSATAARTNHAAHNKISTHALTWSATFAAVGAASRERNFNSRAHVERDPLPPERAYCFVISTHALTWSATSEDLLGYLGETNFNSRAHVERDQTGVFGYIDGKNFNSRAHVERDVESKSKDFFVEEFQLTRSRGARPEPLFLFR